MGAARASGETLPTATGDGNVESPWHAQAVSKNQELPPIAAHSPLKPENVVGSGCSSLHRGESQPFLDGSEPNNKSCLTLPILKRNGEWEQGIAEPKEWEWDRSSMNAEGPGLEKSLPMAAYTVLLLSVSLSFSLTSPRKGCGIHGANIVPLEGSKKGWNCSVCGTAGGLQHQGNSKSLQESKRDDLLKQRFETLLWKNNGIITKWNFTLPANSHWRQETDKQRTMESNSVSCTPQAPPSVLSYLPLLSKFLSLETAVQQTHVLQEKQKFSTFFLKKKKPCNSLTQFKKEPTKS